MQMHAAHGVFSPYIPQMDHLIPGASIPQGATETRHSIGRKERKPRPKIADERTIRCWIFGLQIFIKSSILLQS